MKVSAAIEVGERVFLRRPTARDRSEIVALNRASRALHRPWVTPPTTAEQFQAFLARSRRQDVDTSLICRLEDGAIVGVVTLSQIFRRSFQSAYLGFYVGAAYAGRGYMTDGMELLLKHCFVGLKLHRVEANVQPGNLRSLALVKRSGFRREGFSPRYLKIGGRWCDHERWAMTLEEWRRPGGRRRR